MVHFIRCLWTMLPTMNTTALHGKVNSNGMNWSKLELKLNHFKLDNLIIAQFVIYFAKQKQSTKIRFVWLLNSWRKYGNRVTISSYFWFGKYLSPSKIQPTQAHLLTKHDVHFSGVGHFCGGLAIVVAKSDWFATTTICLDAQCIRTCNSLILQVLCTFSFSVIAENSFVLVVAMMVGSF